jgi:hypothetical protein
MVHETDISLRNSGVRHRWFMPVILATQEAEIRRITARSQPQQIVQRPYLKKTLS